MRGNNLTVLCIEHDMASVSLPFSLCLSLLLCYDFLTGRAVQCQQQVSSAFFFFFFFLYNPCTLGKGEILLPASWVGWQRLTQWWCVTCVHLLWSQAALSQLRIVLSHEDRFLSMTQTLCHIFCSNQACG